MNEKKDALYLECYSGISGDMVTAALLDLGADEVVLRKALASLPLDGFSINISRVKKAGLDAKQYSSHKLRHTAATLMLQNGVDVRTLQEVLGHEHLNTTQIYTHVDNENLRSAAKANPLGNIKPKK